jgi:hypothetical protein
MTRLAMSLPPTVRNPGGDYGEKVTVVGRPRPDSELVTTGNKRKAPFEAAVHLQPCKVVLKATDDRRYALLHSFCKLVCVPLAPDDNRLEGIDVQWQHAGQRGRHQVLICVYMLCLLLGARIVTAARGYP